MKTPRLLLVEDSLVDRKLARHELERELAYCEILEATCVEEALHILKTEPIDCSVVDIELPDGTIADILDELRTMEAPPPVVVLTSHDDESMAAELLSRGVQDYVLKGSRQGLARAVKYAQVRTRVAGLEQKLHQSERWAAVGRLAAGVAHEINNPLSLLHTELFLLQEREGKRSVGNESLGACQHAVNRIAMIVRNLSTLAEKEQGTMVPCSLSQIAREALAMVEHRVARRALLEVLLEGEPVVEVRQHHLTQVVIAMLLNAVEELEPDGDVRHRLRVTVGVAGRSAEVVVSTQLGARHVRDTSSAFASFFVHDARPMDTSLDLSACREIAEEHGGSLSLRPGTGGTRARLVLPLASPRERSVHPPSSHRRLSDAPPSTARSGASDKSRILLVDDDDEVRRSLRRLLSRHFDVVEACGGGAALELLRCDGQSEANLPFDAVLCDVMMPDMDGTELYQRVLLLAPALAARFIFISGGSLSAVQLGRINRSAAPFLAKPLEPEPLLRVLDERCGLSNRLEFPALRSL